jgi:hypothetical protein
MKADLGQEKMAQGWPLGKGSCESQWLLAAGAPKSQNEFYGNDSW